MRLSLLVIASILPRMLAFVQIPQLPGLPLAVTPHLHAQQRLLSYARSCAASPGNLGSCGRYGGVKRIASLSGSSCARCGYYGLGVSAFAAGMFTAAPSYFMAVCSVRRQQRHPGRKEIWKVRWPRVVRQSFIELIFVGAATAWLIANRPNSSPGPTDEMFESRKRLQNERDTFVEALQSSSLEDVAQTQPVVDKLTKQLEEVEEQIGNAEKDLRAYPVPDYLKSASDRGQLLIAVTGSSGSGKSSWINAMRRLKDRDPGAAKVGVTETTMEPQMFTFPGRVGFVRRVASKVGQRLRSLISSKDEPAADPIQVGDSVMLRDLSPEMDGKVARILAQAEDGTVDAWQVRLDVGSDEKSFKVKRHQITGVLAECILWDLPGVGTPRFPQATYVRNMGIRHFDVVVLITANRFTEAELELVEELKFWKVPYFLARNKTDIDVKSEIECEEDEKGDDVDDARREEIATQTIRNVKQYFRNEFNLPQVYCLSTRRKLQDKFEFLSLEQDLAKVMQSQRGIK